MIETHLVNALLKPSLREGFFFAVLNFVNGLVAPSFLFCAGFAFAITLSRRWEAYTHFRPPLWRYVVRLALILTVGYALHLPFFSLSRMRELNDLQSWASFYQADILHVISISIGLLLVVSLAMRRRELSIYIAAVLAFIMVFVSPVVRGADYSWLPIWLRPYLTSKVPSVFPMFPWSAFLLFGAFIGYRYHTAHETNEERPFMFRLPGVALIGILAALFFNFAPITLYSRYDFWGPSPEFFFVRLGLVALFLAGFWWLGRFHRASPKSVAIVFGQESLLVYVAHLLIVYGQDYDWSLARKYGTSLNYLECLGIFLLLAAGMFIVAYSWHRLKAWNKRAAGIVQFAVLSALVLRFVTR